MVGTAPQRQRPDDRTALDRPDDDPFVAVERRRRAPDPAPTGPAANAERSDLRAADAIFARALEAAVKRATEAGAYRPRPFLTTRAAAARTTRPTSGAAPASPNGSPAVGDQPGSNDAFAALGTALRQEVSRLAERQSSLEARVDAAAKQPDLSRLDDRLANVASALVAVADASHQTTDTVARATSRISRDIAGLKTAVEAMDPDRLASAKRPMAPSDTATAKTPEAAPVARPPLAERHVAMAAALQSLGAQYAATRDPGAAEASPSPDPLASVAVESEVEARTAGPATQATRPDATPPRSAHALMTSAQAVPDQEVPARATPDRDALEQIAAAAAAAPQALSVQSVFEIPPTEATSTWPAITTLLPTPSRAEPATADTTSPAVPMFDRTRIARLIGTVRRAAPPPPGARAVVRRSLTGHLGAWSLSRSEAAVFVLLFTGLSLGAYASVAKLPLLSSGGADSAVAAVAETTIPQNADPVSTGSLGAAPRDTAIDPQSLFTLASRLERGEGVAANPERARALYAEAAAAGNVMAMHNLAVMTFEGAGGPRDPSLAASWFEKAAEHGLVDSEFNLAVLYLKGVGVKADPAAAYRWFAIAARTGDAKAAKRAAEVGAKLAPADRARIDTEVAEWHPELRSPAANGQVVADVARP